MFSGDAHEARGQTAAYGEPQKPNWPSFGCPDPWIVLKTEKACARDPSLLIVISPYLWLTD